MAGVILLVAMLAAWHCPASGAEGGEAAYPRRPIRVIVPFAAGGGSDTFVRVMQKAIQEAELLPATAPWVVINVKGAGGTVGSRRVRDARPDGYTILNLHEGLITARHAGVAPYGPEAFEPIAATGASGMVVCVKEDAPWQTIGELFAAATGTPDAIRAAANRGAPSYFALKRLEAAHEGAGLRFVLAGGGAERFADLLGGHADVSAFSIAEYERFRGSGLHALAYLDEARHPAAPEIPTAREQGVEVVHNNMHFWWAPRGTPPERVEALANLLEKAMADPGLREKLAEMQVEPVFLRGAELREEIAQREAAIGAVAIDAGVSLPNLPAIVLSAVLGCGLALVLLPGSSASRAGRAEIPAAGRATVKAAVLAGGFVLLLQSGWVPFFVAALGFTAGWGVLFLWHDRRRFALLLATGAVVAVSCQWLFTRVFVIDLP